MNAEIPEYLLNQMRAELESLDADKVKIDGIWMKPSQCYHLGINPGHILFNTNCPDSLKERIQTILSKYIQTDEGRP